MNETETFYQTVHTCRPSYRNTNMGILSICDWLDLIKDDRGEVHNPWTDKPISIVELGCGNGKLCNLLSEMRMDVTGIDVTSVEHIYNRSGYKFIKQDLADLPYPFDDNQFNYSVNFDVMEHLPEDKISEILKETARITNRGIITKIACSGSPPLHITVKSPGWWLNQLIVNCPDFSWQLVRNYERICQNIEGQEYFVEQTSDARPLMASAKITYAPLFYGKRGRIEN